VGEDETLHPTVKNYEPRVALFAGMDGLEAYKTLSSQFRDNESILNPGGFFILEIGKDQKDKTFIR